MWKFLHIKVVINGKIPQEFMQRYNSQSYRQTYQSGANYKVIEFHGEAIQNMDTSGV